MKLQAMSLHSKCWTITVPLCVEQYFSTCAMEKLKMLLRTIINKIKEKASHQPSSHQILYMTCKYQNIFVYLTINSCSSCRQDEIGFQLFYSIKLARFKISLPPTCIFHYYVTQFFGKQGSRNIMKSLDSYLAAFN